MFLSIVYVVNVTAQLNYVLDLQDIHFEGKELREAPAPVGYH